MRSKTKEKARESRLLRTYGIGLQQYREILQEQGGCCPICLRQAEEFPVSLAVDHNHKTGEIRGLLCNYCNHRVVGRHTDPALVRRIADYIEKGTGLFVPEKPKKKRKNRRKKVK